MNSIVAKIMTIIKDSADSIAREEALKQYFEMLMCQCISEALERIDVELAAEYSKKGWHVERLDARTVQATYGTLTIRRRRMEKTGEKGIYPLDLELGIRRYQRYTSYLEYIIARIGSKTVYRVAAETLNTLTPVTISHQQVSNIVKRAGKHYADWEEEQADTESENAVELRRPEVLYIEGDGLTLSGQGCRNMELHRFQIAEGIKETNGRRELVGTHYIAEFSHTKAKKAMEEYIASHYDLSHTIVISNSDGGFGYGEDTFSEILGKTKQHEHFRDRYHVNRKFKERICWAGRALMNELQKALRMHDIWKMNIVLDTIKSAAETEPQTEQVERLKQYLERNWKYLASMKQRGLEKYCKIIGTCESNHRVYSYRMKKQGRRWSKTGGRSMAKIITGLKNGDFREAIAAKEEYFSYKPRKELRYAVRNALKKGKAIGYTGMRHGRIILDAPHSSAVGMLLRNFGR